MRKTKVVTIEAEGRDKGKQFKLTEMPAVQSEKFAARAFLAIAHSGLEIPDELASAGMVGLALIGIRALWKVSFDQLEPLMDEMFQCIQIIPDPSRPSFSRALMQNGLEGDDIEEPKTRIFLRGEWIELHTNFSIGDALLKLEGPSPKEVTSRPMET